MKLISKMETTRVRAFGALENLVEHVEHFCFDDTSSNLSNMLFLVIVSQLK